MSGMNGTSGDLGLRLQPDASRYTLPRFLADVAARHGDRPALCFEGRTWSYRDLERESRRMARALVGAGVVKGARVALLMPNRPEWVSAAFGVALAGGVLIPVNTFATPDERAHILRHGDASVLLCQRALLRRDILGELRDAHPSLAEAGPGPLADPSLPYLRRVFCLGLEGAEGRVESWSALLAAGDGISDALVAAAAEQVTPGDDALVIYTSGTTALPKGILHAQRAPVVQSWRFAEYLGLGPDDRVWTAQPFFWTAGLAMSLGAALAAGAPLHLEQHFDPESALALLERERITCAHAWPHQEKALAEHPSASRRDLSSLRCVEFASPLARLAGIEKDEWGIYASYGLSETFTLAAALPASAPAETRARTHGRALPGMELRIVDPQGGEPLPAEARGEIAVRGATLMRGYYKLEPELAFDASGFFHTQDGGWLDAEGFLHWTGRLSNLIKTGGANVAPAEIEAKLGDVPGLRVAAAVGVPHPSLGEAVVLCAVPVSGASLDAEGLRARLRERLAAYKVPRRVLVFAEDEVEFTGNQKLQVAGLRERALRRLEAEGAEIAGHRYGSGPGAPVSD